MGGEKWGARLFRPSNPIMRASETRQAHAKHQAAHAQNLKRDLERLGERLSSGRAGCDKPQLSQISNDATA